MKRIRKYQTLAFALLSVGVCLVLLLPLAALADSLTGKVVKITDGDTLYVLDANYEQHKIRLVPPNPA